MKSVACIASSESLGLAGIAVDLRVCAALGVHGRPVVASVTAQPAGAVASWSVVAPETFRSQLDLALDGPAPAAVKIGLLPDAGLAELLARRLEDVGLPVVLDPVGATSRGQFFLDPECWRRTMLRLIPSATLITPNLPELRALCEAELEDRDATLIEAARSLPLREGSGVLIKGGHRSIDADDLLVTAGGERIYAGERFDGEFRGSGCALSTAIAALLARGRAIEDAVDEGREFLRAAMQDAVTIGEERIPHLFWEYYGSEGLP